MPPIRTQKRKIACPNCGEKCKPGSGISMHLRLHCKQKNTDDTGPTGEVLEHSGNEACNNTESVVNSMDVDWTPPEIKEAITLCREFLRRKIVYTGRTLNANTFARRFCH